MSDLNVALSVIGGLILGLSLVVGLLKGRSYLPTQPLIAVLVGVLIGPDVLGVLRLAQWGDPMTILEQVARLTITFSVLGAALRIPKTYFSDQAKAMGTLLGPGRSNAPSLLVSVFAVVTLLAAGLLWIVGMPAWASLDHAMTGLATGGFVVTDTSFKAYNDLIRLAALPVMFVGAIPLPAY